MKRRRTLVMKPEDEKHEILSISVAASGENFVFLQSHSWNLVYWSLEKNKQIASTHVFSNENISSGSRPSEAATRISDSGEVPYNISMCPYDDNKMMVVGPGLVRTFRLNDGPIRSFQMTVSKEEDLYNAVLWKSIDKALICCDNSRVLLVQHGECLGEIKLEGVNSGINFTNITGFSKGIALGDDRGNLYVFKGGENSSELTVKSKFELLKKVPLLAIIDNSGMDLGSVAGSCLSLLFNAKEDQIFVTTRSKYTISIVFANCRLFKDEDARVALVLPPGQQSSIIAVETSVWKPYVATLSKDQSLHVWNYMENTCETSHMFSEPVYAMSMHFMGIYVVVAFQNRIQLLHILKNGMRTVHDATLRNVTFLKFSNGGHCFAAVEGNSIHIYDTWTFDLKCSLVGHRGRVRSVTWDPLDHRVTSAGEDGCVYHWSMSSLKRDGEFVLKNQGFNHVISGPSLDTVIAISNDNVVHLIDPDRDDDIVYDLQVTKCALVTANKRLYIGTRFGQVVVVDLNVKPAEISERYQVSFAPINSLAVSIDGKYVVCAADDGSVAVMTFPLSDGVAPQDKLLIEEILVSSTDLEEKTAKIVEHKGKAEEIKSENDYQLHLKEVQFQEELKAMEEDHTRRCAEMTLRNQNIRENIENEKMRFAREKDRLEKEHDRALKAVEVDHEHKLELEKHKQTELAEHLEKVDIVWREKTEKTSKIFETNRRQKEMEFSRLLQEKVDRVDVLQTQLQEQMEENNVTMKELEQDSDDIIIQTRYKYEVKLKEEKENGFKYRAENLLMKKKHDLLMSEIDTLQLEIQKAMNEEKKLQLTMKNLDRDIQGLEKEIKERDTAIIEKDKRIDELKKKNQELEKFKSVLDYKLKELKREMEPREKEIQSLLAQIEEMDAELSQHHQLNNILELKHGDLQNRFRTSESEVTSIKKDVEQLNHHYKKLQIELAECASSIKQPKEFKTNLLHLYQKYCKANSQPNLSSSSGNQSSTQASHVKKPHTADATRQHHLSSRDKQKIKEEITSQRDQLEKALKQMKEKVEHDKDSHRLQNTRIMRENMMLIDEINQLRKEMKRKQALMKSMGKNVTASIDFSSPATTTTTSEPQ